MTTSAIKIFLQEARAAMKNGANEHVLRAIFQQHLSVIFPDRPWWVQRHAKGVESHTKFVKEGKLGYGFVDALVGSTAIEYEPSLAKTGVADHARKQVREYIAGQVNSGTAIDRTLGVISDTLRWKAYRAQLVAGAPAAPPYGEVHIVLDEIASLDLVAASPTEDQDLVRFLTRHLGRIGARPLDASHLADDLGLDSPFGIRSRQALTDVYDFVAQKRHKYADLIDRLWAELVDAIGKGGTRQLGVDEYIDEFYLITLAKLICANVLAPQETGRTNAELSDILTGTFFTGRGLPNYVEYDLFGWLSADAHTTGLLAIAQDIQLDLLAYDFRNVRQQDLFGQLLSKLGRQHMRLILGQELTPPWLARRLVSGLTERLGTDPMRLVDTACGSGAILVEALRAEEGRIDPSTPASDIAARLVSSATGFDIDPLAALFAKTNWVIAMRDHLPHLGDVTIPIFHADSLFAGLYGEGEKFQLKLDGTLVEPPASLLDAAGRPVFDAVLSKAYELAMEAAKQPGAPDVSLSTQLAQNAVAEAPNPTDHDVAKIAEFAATLIREIAVLQRNDRNGLWSYVIRNTSRAAQSEQQFNVLAINPPWLALSKIKDNPYAVQLERLAREFGIEPAAQSFLHVEMASVFLLEGVRRYLADGGHFGCILPSAIMNGNHQNRLRAGAYANARRKVDMDVDAIWAIDKTAFKNDAVVVLGRKVPFAAKQSFPGISVSETGEAPHQFFVIAGQYEDQATRVVWSPEPSAQTVGFGMEPAPFRQGADLMPRTLWFHDFHALPNSRYAVESPLDNDALRYLVADAKVAKSFRLPAGNVDGQFITHTVLSNHLTPFGLAEPATMLMPGLFENGSWRAVTGGEFAISGTGSRQAFAAISKELGKPPNRLFEHLDERRKLQQQRWLRGQHIVVSGAGGANPCAAWLKPDRAEPGKVIFDQTVYWAPVNDEDEAIYLVGAINSPTCALLIRPFQPRGQQGARHVHKLPFGVTPPYDAADMMHRTLITTTKALAVALALLARSDPAVSKAQKPNGGSLASRRTKIGIALRQLPEWTPYEAASAAIYAA